MRKLQTLDIEEQRLALADPVDLAFSQLGVSEDPPGSNAGLPAQRYQRGKREVAWCVYFVLWCYEEAARFPTLVGQKAPAWSAWASALAFSEALRARGWDVGRGLRPKRNDIIVITRTGGSGRHVGLVHDSSLGHVHSIDGNVSQRVEARTRAIGDSHILFYLRPPVSALSFAG